MPNTKTGGNRWIPDIRPENIDTYTETYTPSGEAAQSEEYKIVDAHPIINGLLNKMGFFRTHAAAVWYNKLANKTVIEKLNDLDTDIRKLNKMLPTGSVSVYVSSSGSDTTGDGTQENPWRQISRAISAYRICMINVNLNIHVTAGTYNGFSASGRRVTIILEGDVTIDGGGNKCIAVDQLGSCSINASQANTYNITLRNGTNAVYVVNMSRFSISGGVKKVTLGTLTQTAVYVSFDSFCVWNADFTINATFEGPSVFSVLSDGYLQMYFSSAMGVFNANSTNAVYALRGGRAYIKNLNISNKCTYGLRASEGGQIYHTDVTNNAATPQSASSGGRIYAGTQTSVPNY